MKQILSIPYVRLSNNELSREDATLIAEAVKVAQDAYAPYSQFKVGAAVLLENGIIVTGSNQENAAYPSGLCAERTALFYAGAQYPDVPVLALAVVAFNNIGQVEQISPCGSCRQVLVETSLFAYCSRVKMKLLFLKMHVFACLSVLMGLICSN